MELNDYQNEALEYAAFDKIDYPFLALAEEVGEVMGKLAKFSRKNNYSLHDSLILCHTKNIGAQLREDLTKELGDVLWQLSACCNELGLSLEEVATQNLSKLYARKERGTIVGEGDDR